MYFLMNKNNIVATFYAKSQGEFSDSATYELKQAFGKLPIGFKDINSWLDGRKASKHNSHLQTMMKQMGCDDNESFIQMTHATTINDTFWIKSSREELSWSQVSLYQNQFSEKIAKAAFEGVCINDITCSFKAPELTCDGSFRKCFRKEVGCGEWDSDIFLYKRGAELGTGLEPYCEQMASEIAHIISPDNSVGYDLVKLYDKTASRCNLFTNEQYGYASFAKVTDVQKLDFQGVFDYFAELGSEQSFREMLVLDALCINQDRHAGNYGVLFDNDTLQVIKMSPVFDLNISLMPYITKDEFLNIGDKLFEYTPKLGSDFTRIGQMGMNDILRDRVKDIKDFSFSFRGDDVFLPERVEAVEYIVRRQAEAILSPNKLYTKDVFFSQKANDLEAKTEQAQKASKLMNIFADRLEQADLGADTYISVCDSINDVQCIVENDSYTIVVDFLNSKMSIEQNVKAISPQELKKQNRDFYYTYEQIRSKFKMFMEEEKHSVILPE